MSRFLFFFISFLLSSQLCACSSIDLFNANKASSEHTFTNTQSPKKIALLLPLHGKYGESGKAIRNGFMTAFYAQKNQGSAPSIRVIDTSGQDINLTYRKAVAEGADVVVGPLDKESVNNLIRGSSLSVPTLALNTVTPRPTPNLIQFSLSQSDEAEQVASKALDNGLSQALIIAPTGTWAKSIVDSFEARWRAGGGVIVDQLYYQNSKQLPEQIRLVMHVEKPLPRKKQSKQILSEEEKVQPKRRQDIDMIFLLAEPARAREIAPLLTFNYAGNLPVYATSLIYSGIPRPNLDNDLDNIHFVDMPWVLGQLPNDLQTLQNNASQVWKNSYQHQPRLYAFGVDAFEIATHLNQVQNSGGFNGATGNLSWSNQQIHRNLKWAKMRHGTPL